MADPRYIRGDTNPNVIAVDTATAINRFDMIAQSSGKAINAGAWPWDTDLATTQTAFVAAFLGISGQRKDANVARVHGNSTDNELRYDASGVFEFDCASASFAVGDLVGPAKQTGNLLEPQKVVAVTTLAKAIGRVAEATSNATRVRVRVTSVLQPTSRA